MLTVILNYILYFLFTGLMSIADEIRKDPGANGFFFMNTDIQLYVGYLSNLTPSAKATATTLLLEVFKKKTHVKKLAPLSHHRSQSNKVDTSVESGTLIHSGEDIMTHILSKDRTQRVAGVKTTYI